MFTNQTNHKSAVGTATIGQAVTFLFPISETSDIVVKSVVTLTGVETLLAITTNYTVTIADDDGGGTVTMVTAVAATSTIHITRATPMTQELDLVAGGTFNAENIEDSLDKVTKMAIDNKKALDFCLRLPDTDSESAELSAFATRAGKFLYFGAGDGDPTVAESVTTGETTISAFAETVIDDADAGAMFDTLGISAFSQTMLDDADATTALSTLGLTVSAFGKTVIDDADADAVQATLHLQDYTDTLKLNGLLMKTPVVNVKAFGATGDGATDDRANIQTAIDYCETNTLGTVYFPTGTYIINAPLTITQTRFNIIGDSMWRTQIHTGDTWAGARMLDFTGNKSWLSVRDIHINGPGALVGSPIGMYFDITVQVELRNVLIRNCGTGLDMDGNTTFRMDNVYFSTNYLGCKFTDIRSICSTNCVFEGSVTIGLAMSGVSRSVFTNPWFEANEAYGMYCEDACINNTFIGGYWGHTGTQDTIYFNNSLHKDNIFINAVFEGAGTSITNASAVYPPHFVQCKAIGTVTGIYRSSFKPYDLLAEAAWNPASIANGAMEAKDVVVTGALKGDFASASYSLDVADLTLDAQVTGNDVVTCVLANNTGGAVDLGVGTVYVRVFKK